MTTVNHWGRIVDSDTPITGVYGTNSIAWEFMDDGICTVCDNRDEWPDFDDEEDDYQSSPEDFIECDSSHTKLIGDWTTTDNGLDAWFEIGGVYYMPDQSKEFAAIERETTVQVVWSKFVERHGLCSPCYPGQADADSVGEFLCYALPAELLYKE